MRNSKLNILNYLLQTKNWKKYYLKKIIIKSLKKNANVSKNQKFLINLKKWNLNKRYFLSSQTNVCKMSGNFKRTLDMIGYNRHMVRKHLALNDIPHIKKLSW